MSKGGGADTSGMEQATAQSNALQERMYEEGVARQQPFYDIGLGGANKLSDYLGIDRTPQQRDSIYQSLLPQYTTTSGGAPYGSTGGAGLQGDIFRTLRQGEAEQLTPEQRNARQANSIVSGGITGSDRTADATSLFQNQTGMSPTAYLSLHKGGAFGGTPQTSSIDYDALNSAVDARMGSQERPDYFGSLLDPFSMDKFEADPSYEFRKAEGQKGLERSQASKSGVLNPRAIKEMDRYSQNLASQEYGNAYNRYNIDQDKIYNRLSGILGMGQQSTQQLNMAGTQYAGQVGQNNMGLANAQASAQQANQTGKQSMFNTLLGAGAQLGLGAMTGGASTAMLPYTSKMLFS